MFTHFVAGGFVGLTFLTAVHTTFAAVKHLPGPSGVPVPMQRSVKRAVLIIVLVTCGMGMLLAFSP
jgi:hypothetical protein